MRRPNGAPTKETRQRNDAIATKLDQLPVDGVLRLKADDCPRIKWVLDRGYLNNFKLRTTRIDSDLVVLRVK